MPSKCLKKPQDIPDIKCSIGQHHDFQLSTGKMGKYLKNYVSANYWALYVKTYADADYANMWNALFTACTLFRSMAKDAHMSAYLKQIRMLSPDAKTIL